MHSQFDALVIGAGVAGSTAAILLAKAGWSVAIIERQRFPRRKVCGECVAASNLPLLDALGIGEGIERHAGAALRRVALCTGESLAVADLPGYDHPRHRWGRAIAREHLDTLLLGQAAACGGKVWQPWVVRETGRVAGRHVCTLQSLDSGRAAKLSAPLLIDAHGSWEASPRPYGASASPVPWVRNAPQGSDLFAFKGNFIGARLDADLLPILAFAGGYGGMVQAADGQLTLACCIRRDALQAIRQRSPGRTAAQVVQHHLQDSCAIVREALGTARPQHRWLSVGPIRPGIRAAAPAPGRFAVGNAAGEAHPILGEGMSMAVQSAWLLVAALESASLEASTDRMLERAARLYSAAWRRGFTTRIRSAAVLAQVMMRPASAALLQPLLGHWPSLLTHGARLGGKVRCVVRNRLVQLPRFATPLARASEQAYP